MSHVRYTIRICMLSTLAIGLAACANSIIVPAGAYVGDASTTNGSVRIEARAHARKASSVNGSIELADLATTGDVHTINGGIMIGRGAVARRVSTINGAVTLGPDATVIGNITTVNGSISLAPGSVVNGELGNTNGDIRVKDAEVGNGLFTDNGDIKVTGDSVVDGGITVSAPAHRGFLSNRRFARHHSQRVVIGPGATVNGALTFKKRVELYISYSARVAGPITGTSVVHFKGASPAIN